MEERRANRRLLAIVGIGVLTCAVAVGVRMVHRKPIHGLWTGYSYQEVDGRMVPDKDFGLYMILLNKDGTYEETGNATSGKWSKAGDTITLSPVKFYDMTPEQHRKKYRRKDGKVSLTIERLLKMRMQPMTVGYNHSADTLSYHEPTMYYEFSRSN